MKSVSSRLAAAHARQCLNSFRVQREQGFAVLLFSGVQILLCENMP